jgi:hypothetical protein
MTERDPEDIMRELWGKFLATNPGPDFKPWDQMDEFERAIMRAQMLPAELR